VETNAAILYLKDTNFVLSTWTLSWPSLLLFAKKCDKKKHVFILSVRFHKARYMITQGDQKVSLRLKITVQKHAKIF
jgi:hypothetical protein